MKKTHLVISLVLSSIFINAQPLIEQWSTNVGGSNEEVNGFFMDGKASIDVDVDGNVYMAVGTVSTDSMANGNHGYEDIIITKHSSNGTQLWSKVFGGSDGDRPRDILVLSNGDFAIVGYTYSNDGDLPNHHGGADGAPDGFIARFDKDGTLIWSKQYGGTYFAADGSDLFYSGLEKEDGNLVAVGTTNSQNGDLPPDWISANPSFKVGWFVEVDGSDGTLIKSKRVKSTNHDESNENTLEDIVMLKDGSGYCTIGYQGYFLNGIHWTTKIDTAGDLVWENEIGGINGLFVYEAGVEESYDGNIIVALTNGLSNTTNFKGQTDMWVVKLNKNNGNTLSETNFGGSDFDIPYKLLPDGHGRYYLAGYSSSTDDFAHGGDSLKDNFIIYLDDSYDTLWTYRFGGSENDVITDLALGKNGELYISGSSRSSNGFYTTNFGGTDAWVGKFENLQYDYIESKIDDGFILFPNPANNYFMLMSENLTSKSKITMFDDLGRRSDVNYSFSNNRITVNTTDLSEGIYLLQMISGDNVFNKRIIISK